MAYVYIRNPECYTVGFFDPDGQFVPESDHDNHLDAAMRVNYLNGGNK